MATFPALVPSSRVYTPGQRPSSLLTVLTGDDVAVKHNNIALGYRLQMTFDLLTQSENYSIISHYSLHNRFQAFDLDSTTLVAADLTFPAGYLWIYAASPESTEVCGQVNTRVELELVPPYTI